MTYLNVFYENVQLQSQMSIGQVPFKDVFYYALESVHTLLTEKENRMKTVIISSSLAVYLLHISDMN